MTDTPHLDKVHVDGILSRAAQATPGWVYGMCGGMLTMSVCTIAVLQLGGFTPPLQRIMNAKATEIERAAESLTNSATQIKGAADRLTYVEGRLGAVEARITDVEERLDGVDRYHGVK